MANVLFGMGQISKPTPTSINTFVRAVTVAGAIFLAWMSTANIIGIHTKDILTQILGLLLGLINGLAPLFGVQLPPNTNVDAKDVSAMENK